MHLVSSLAAGIRGAENGTVQIFVRATSTRAVFYEDFIGNIHPLSGTDLTLDENGRALVYVNQFVDLTIIDSDGDELLSFTEGYSSPNEEVISNSFTGTDYTSGATGANKPTNLQSVLDLWKTTNGAKDWKVLFAGSEISVQSAVAGIAGIFINVKDPTYGAVGDGVTDDTTPIQNALNAASSTKGIVVFPSGTYKTTAKLTVPADVSLWGVGSSASKISLAHATADAVEFTGGTAWYQEMRGMWITTSQANTGKMVSVLGLVSITNCVIAPASSHTGNVIVLSGAGFLLLGESSIAVYTSDSSGAIDGASGVLHIRNCFVSTQSTTYNGTLVSMKLGTITGSTISLASMTGGTAIGAAFSATTQATVVGNTFAAGSSTDTAMAITSNTSTTQFVEAGNIFTGTWTTTYSGFNMGTNNPLIQMVSREAAIRNVSSDATTLDLQAHLYGTTIVTRAAAGTTQQYTSTVGPPGAFFTLVVYNNSGGALTNDPTFGSGFYAGTPALTKPANTKISVAHFRAVYAAGTGTWAPIATAITNI